MRENHTVAAVDRVPGATRIMGVDPGLTRCGFSMLDMTADRKAHFVNVGVAGTDPARALDQRILWIFAGAGEYGDWYGARLRRGDFCGGDARCAGVLPYALRGEGGGDRQRSRG